MILETRLLLVNKPKKRQLTSNTYPSVIVFAFWNVNEFHFKEQQNALGSSLEKILPCLVFVVQTWHRGLTSESNDFAALKHNWNRLTQSVRICYELYFLVCHTRCPASTDILKASWKRLGLVIPVSFIFRMSLRRVFTGYVYESFSGSIFVTLIQSLTLRILC